MDGIKRVTKDMGVWVQMISLLQKEFEANKVLQYEGKLAICAWDEFRAWMGAEVAEMHWEFPDISAVTSTDFVQFMTAMCKHRAATDDNLTMRHFEAAFESAYDRAFKTDTVSP